MPRFDDLVDQNHYQEAQIEELRAKLADAQQTRAEDNSKWIAQLAARDARIKALDGLRLEADAILRLFVDNAAGPSVEDCINAWGWLKKSKEADDATLR